MSGAESILNCPYPLLKRLRQSPSPIASLLVRRTSLAPSFFLGTHNHCYRPPTPASSSLAPYEEMCSAAASISIAFSFLFVAIVAFENMIQVVGRRRTSFERKTRLFPKGRSIIFIFEKRRKLRRPSLTRSTEPDSFFGPRSPALRCRLASYCAICHSTSRE